MANISCNVISVVSEMHLVDMAISSEGRLDVPDTKWADGAATRVLPVISNIVPAPGTGIYASDTLQFDVTDDSGLFTAIVIMVEYPDGNYEVVYDGNTFAYNFQNCTKSVITNGFRYYLRRRGGWPGSPTARIRAIDQGGSENTQ